MEMEVVLGIGEEAKPSSENGSAKEQDEKVDVAQENGVKEDVVEDCMMNGVSSLLKLKQDSSDIQEGKENDEEEEEEKHGYCVGDFVWGKIKNHPWWPGQIYDPSDASDLALKINQNRKLLVAYFGDGTFAWCGPSQLKPFSECFKECSTVSNSKSFLGAVEEAVGEMGRHIERLLICDCAEEKHEFDSREVKNAGIKEGVLVPHVRRDKFSELVVGKPGVILQDVKTSAETVSFSDLLDLEILKRKISAFYRSKRGYGLTEYHEPQPVPGLEDKNKDDDDENIDNGSEWQRRGAKCLSKEEEEEKVGDEEASDPEEAIQRSLQKCSGFPDHRLQHRRKEKSIAELLENESAAKVTFEAEPADGNVKSSRKKVKHREEGKNEVENVSTTTSKIRRISELSTIEDAGQKKAKENGKDKTLSKKKKKRDVDDNDCEGSGDGEESSPVEEVEKNEVLGLESDIDSTPLASLRKRVRDDGASIEKNAENGETTTLTEKRERKKSKYFSPDYLSDFSWKGRKKSKIGSKSSKVSSQSQVGGDQMTGGSGSLIIVEQDKLDKPGEPALDNGFSHQELSQELSNAVDFLRLGATSEEMRDLIRVAALGTEYPEDSSSKDMVREFMSIYRSFTYQDGANNKLLRSSNSSEKEKEDPTESDKPENKGKERKDKKRKAKQQAEEIKQSGKAENETNKLETAKTESKSKKSESKKPADEDEETPKESTESTKKEKKPKKPKLKKQADEEQETLKESSESTKKDRKSKKSKSMKQADEEGHESIKKERKAKKPKSKLQADEEEKLPKESSETTKSDRKRKKAQYQEEEMRNETEKPEKKKKKREGKSKKQKMDEKKMETEKDFSGAELFITFGPGSNLPTKEELIDIYEKFGALDEEWTYMFYTNYCARVAFLNIADGEKAFESSQEKCPFASTSAVKFRLKYPNERREEKNAEVAETTSEMEYVKKKLEEMRSLVDESEGGISEENKVKLEDEMVNLLEKVRKMRSS